MIFKLLGQTEDIMKYLFDVKINKISQGYFSNQNMYFRTMETKDEIGEKGR